MVAGLDALALAQRRVALPARRDAGRGARGASARRRAPSLGHGGVGRPGQAPAFSWHPGREPESAQWVDVEFVAVGAGTRVTLTHGGWEALGEIAPILRREYASGWRDVLEKHFAGRARESN